MAQSTESPLPPPWTLPPCIAPRLVYPDISPAVLSKNGASGPVGDDQQQQKEIVAKDSDPGRMGVWVCLLHGTSIPLRPMFLLDLSLRQCYPTSNFPCSPSNSRLVKLIHVNSYSCR
ncbi:hypothetical protein J008_02484 [Cryptococcus neoformans]|nr:hypothetical protein C362_02109 [Cryptococcus neoformans var. grubii Bt1]OXH34932.1 hypothetical protein J008_02484 [Cryptococcus neoformans var. grubii]